jgi:hypothetical protein
MHLQSKSEIHVTHAHSTLLLSSTLFQLPYYFSVFSLRFLVSPVSEYLLHSFSAVGRNAIQGRQRRLKLYEYITYIQANLPLLDTTKYPLCFGVKLRLFTAGEFQLYFTLMFSKTDVFFNKCTFYSKEFHLVVQSEIGLGLTPPPRSNL